MSETNACGGRLMASEKPLHDAIPSRQGQE